MCDVDLIAKEKENQKNSIVDSITSMGAAAGFEDDGSLSGK